MRHTSGDDDIIMVSRLGQSIRFHESDVRPMGRNTSGRHRHASAQGRRGHRHGHRPRRLGPVRHHRERLRQAHAASPSTRSQGRGGLGVRTITLTDRKGYLAGVRVVRENHEIVLQSRDGVVIRMRADGISGTGAPLRACRS